MRKGYYGASIMPVEVLKEIQRRLPQVRLWNLYGQTEIAPVATVLKPEDQLRKAGSAGRAALNVETRVVDDEMNDVQVGRDRRDRAPLAAAAVRLLQRRRAHPRRVRRRLVPQRRSRRPSTTRATSRVVDRKKDMIKTGGENVASREVEEAIYGIEGVSEVAVIGLPDPKWIEAVTAVIVAKPGHVLTRERRHGCLRRPARDFKIPKRVILTDALPKNPSGKLLKRELRLKYAYVVGGLMPWTTPSNA